MITSTLEKAFAEAAKLTEREQDALAAWRIETIAAGRGVYIRHYLERTYGKGRWRKMKGIATVELADGTICEAEIHWFEAHGIGRKDFKIKRVIR